MGYSTYFDGSFRVTPPLRPEHKQYLSAFSRSRRVRRNPDLLGNSPDPIREAVGLPLGEDACYYVAHAEEDPLVRDDPSLVEINSTPEEQPTFWCDWCPSDDGAEIVWNEGDKFYLYVDWLQYLLDHFLMPWGYVLNGEVEWRGEEEWDSGLIEVTENQISVRGAIYVTERDEVRRLRVFLCHAKEDAAVVNNIREHLEADYVHAWMDETDLIPGQDWRLEIEQALEAADLVIICLSVSSVDKRGFVQKEIALALDLVDMQPEGRIFVIPLRLNECSVPKRLRKWQWLDLTSDDFESKLRATLIRRAEEISEAAQPNQHMEADT